MSMLNIIAASRRRFNPLQLSPALWLSDTGSSAGTWPDLSGNGRDATQGTAGNQPQIVTNALNGRQVRRFDGNDFLFTGEILTAQPFTAICVAKTTETGIGGRPVLGEDSSSQTGSIGACGRRATGTHILFAGSVVAGGTFGTNWNIRSDTANGASSSIFANGQSIASGDAGNRFGIRRIGGNYNSGGAPDFFLGDIAEIIIFPTALSTGDRQKVERYLSAKYNIALA